MAITVTDSGDVLNTNLSPIGWINFYKDSEYSYHGECLRFSDNIKLKYTKPYGSSTIDITIWDPQAGKFCSAGYVLSNTTLYTGKYVNKPQLSLDLNLIKKKIKSESGLCDGEVATVYLAFIAKLKHKFPR